MDVSQKRILIVRPDRLGDVVLSTPLPREIKKKYPGSFVAVYVRDYAKDIYVNNPNVDEIIIHQKSKNLTEHIKSINEIRSFRFTHSLTLLPKEDINYKLFFAGIPIRIGVGHKFFQFITNTKSVYRRKLKPLRHESDYCLDTIRKLGIEVSDMNPEIYLTPKEIIEANEFKKNILCDKKYLIGIHAGSGKSSPNWSVERYKSFAEELSKNQGLEVVFTDNEIPDILKNTRFKFVSRNKRLRDDVVMFSALDFLISASTGPMHVASALGVKTISLFCPLPANSVKLWGPLPETAHFVLPEHDYCQNLCPVNPDDCRLEGERGITIEKVLNKINELISEK
ncbi:MAG: glycosyltransferase family 9 protein [Melioribacteraceae bacterium]|nr:glycosyltransferase family 9 protein [Melioribacteraceae bacterium]MCF8354626.1 glycosyltransferase family 9 protein [Melioribacteraceae bacterium]MCF8395014.1 glycosyltransferase family 9 protein [Melioribacteraceae bacterium]MCF8418882.1 glycosyltransferase family 9 protein [Melioribacteraceae bacterium]